MDLRLLQSYLVMVEEGSLSAASRRLHVSQPALSQQLRALEEELGEALLHRRSRGVEPTAAGEVLLAHARGLLAQAERLRGEFHRRRDLESGSVVFGIIPTLAPYLLPQWLGPFRKEHPRMVLSIHEERTDQLVPQVVAGELEFAILSDVPSGGQGRGSLQLRELFREPLLLALPESHPLALRKTDPEPEEIDPAELIHLSGGHCLADHTRRIWQASEEDSRVRCDQIGTALAMVSAGMGLTIVPKLASRDVRQPNLVCRPFAGKGLHRVVHLLKRRSTRLGPAAARLLEKLKR